MQTLLLAVLSMLLLSAGSIRPRRKDIQLHVQQLQTPDSSAVGGMAAAADGSVARPYGTIHEARDHIRELRRQSPGIGAATVIIGPGIYQPLELKSQDSGTPSAPVTYQAKRSDGSTLISGGVSIPASAFTPLRGSPGIVTADLSKLQAPLEFGSLGSGGSCYGNCTQFEHNSVVFDDRLMVLARWPNIKLDTRTFGVKGKYTWHQIHTGSNDTFVLNSTVDNGVAARVAQWTEEKDPWVHIYTQFDWSDSWHPIVITSDRSKNNTVATRVTLQDWTCTLGDCNPIIPSTQTKFAGVNLKSELDTPGEYYIDLATKQLFFFPPLPLEQWHDRQVFVTSNLTAARIHADHITLRGLAIRHARGNGVLALNVSNVRMENCTVSGHGQHGTVIVGTRSGVEHSRIYSVGCSGVRVAGGDAHSLSAGHSFVFRNAIFDMALHKRTYSPGIFFGGIGNNYSYNNVSNSPHNCISGGGNVAVPWGWTGATAHNDVVAGSGSEMNIEGNRLDACANDCGDCGAFYTNGQAGMAYVSLGNKLLGNIFMNTGSTNVYLDDAISGWEIADNVMSSRYPTLRDDGHPKALVLAGGRHVQIVRNAFVDMIARSNAVAMLGSGGDCQASKQLVQRLLYPGSPWPVRYPSLLSVTTDHPCLAARDTIADNRFTLARGYPRANFSFFSNDPLVPWDDDTAANMRTWTTRVANNTEFIRSYKDDNKDRGSFSDLKTDDASIDEPCSGLVLQSTRGLTVSFSSCTGELLSLSRRNSSLVSNVLGHASDAPDNGPFALWLNAPPPWVAANAPDQGSDAMDQGNRSCSGTNGCVALPLNGSHALTAADCRMVSHSLSYPDGLPLLTMILEPRNSSIALRIRMTATFSQRASPELVLSLAVQNVGMSALTMQVALPMLRGVRLSHEAGAADLGIQHKETGLTGFPAWGGCPANGGVTSDSCGGMLGYHVSSLWQQVYASDSSQGLAVIVHDVSGAPRMLGRFAENASTGNSGAIYSLKYPAVVLESATFMRTSPVSLVLHAGGWREGAQYYRSWLASVGAANEQKIPSWLYAHTHSKGSFWIPSPASVAGFKKTGVGMTSFTQLADFAFNTEVDMIEIAMWWDMPNRNYGGYAADGLFKPRSDLGGAEALAEGIRRVQASGRRVQLYLSADVVHAGSGLFTKQMSMREWAQWWDRVGPGQQGTAVAAEKAVKMCHAFPLWQRTIADAVSRTMNATRADGIRLDGVGNFHLYPCFNPNHKHHDEYATHGLHADLELLRASRAAMDAHDARTGRQTILSTEGYSDVYSLDAQLALISWVGYPAANDVSPARAYIQGYLGATYSKYTDVARSMLDGWIASGALDTPEERGWNVLRESFASVYTSGNLSTIDPYGAPYGPALALRLYEMPDFYLLISTPKDDVNSFANSASVLVTLPITLNRTTGLSIDVATLTPMPIDVSAGSNVAIPARLSATILPRPWGQFAYLDVVPMTPPRNASVPFGVRQGSALTLRVVAARPWTVNSPNMTVAVSSFGVGLALQQSTLDLTHGPQVLRIFASPNASIGPSLLRFHPNEFALPARRWIHVLRRE